MQINKFGILFNYYNDKIAYIFPWQRVEFDNRFMSLILNENFKSLKDIKKRWEIIKICNACDGVGFTIKINDGNVSIIPCRWCKETGLLHIGSSK